MPKNVNWFGMFRFAIRNKEIVSKLIKLIMGIYASVQPTSPGGIRLTQDEREKFTVLFWDAVDSMIKAIEERNE